MDGWLPISTAPKDGTLIKIGWKLPEDAGMQEWFIMRWGHIQQNGLFPGRVGMWVASDGNLTWNDDGEGGPTHWMPLSSEHRLVTAAKQAAEIAKDPPHDPTMEDPYFTKPPGEWGGEGEP